MKNSRVGLSAMWLSGSILVLSACSLTPSQPISVMSTTDCDFRPVLNVQQRTAKRRLSEADTSIPQSVSDGLHVNMLDKSISNKIQIHNLSERLSETGTTAVNAIIVNCTDFPLLVQGRTQFVSRETGVPETSSWKSIHLAGRSQEVYSESSLSDQGVSARMLEVREGF